MSTASPRFAGTHWKCSNSNLLTQLIEQEAAPDIDTIYCIDYTLKRQSRILIEYICEFNCPRSLFVHVLYIP